jgi:hypothetical protein
MTARSLLVGAGGATLVAVVVLGVIWIVDSGTTRPASSRDKRAASLRECVALWNDPANSRQRAALNTAALLDPGAAPTAPGSVPLERRVLVLRYAGPPQEDVGVGESGVNANRGECMVVHPSNVLFLYTKAAWHQVGYSPGLAFEGIPQRATSSPNAVMVVRKPATRPPINAGRIALTR